MSEFDVTYLITKLREIPKQVLRDLGIAAVGVAKIAASYVNGNPYLEIAGRTGSSPDANKRYKVALPYLAYGDNAPTAGELAKYSENADEDRIVDGRVVDLADAKLDAQKWGTVAWAQAGNTVLLSDAAEETTTSSTYVEAKRFNTSRPGRYRVTGELSRSGGTTKARVVRIRADGSKAVLTNEATYAGAVHPTYGAAFTLDFIVTVPPDAILSVEFLNDSGLDGYIQNVDVKWTEATAVQALWDAVI
jgi:hypothetical protein